MGSNPTPAILSLRFAGKRDRKLGAWLPNPEVLDGRRECAARMLCCAIRARVSAQRHSQRAALLLEIGGELNERQARRELAFAAADRLAMRQDALWARIFARQIDEDDSRLAEISARRYEFMRRSARAAVWSARWRKVHAMKLYPGGRRADVDQRLAAALERIARAHDAINPWGTTLLDKCTP